MASSRRTMRLPVIFEASPSTPTISRRFWDAIVAHSAMWCTGRGPTCCFPPNSDVYTLFPSIAMPPSRIRSILLWGYCSEDASLRLLPELVVDLDASVCPCHGPECRTQGQGAAHKN